MFTGVYNKFYLAPVDGRKSFYNKCYVEIMGNEATLYSYNTPICIFNRVTRELTKCSAWNYSQTTRRHQKAFLAYYGIEA